MKVNEFVEEYKQHKDKDEYIKKHILLDKYVPYVEKITRCKNIIDKTMYTELNGEKVFKKNSTSQYLLYTLTLIDLYTDLDIDFKNLLDEYDELEKYALITPIISFINENELQTWQTISNMIIDDLMVNTRSIVSWIDNKIDILSLMMNSIQDISAETISKE